MKQILSLSIVALVTLFACNMSSKITIKDPQQYDDFVENLLKQLEKTERDLGLSYTTGIPESIESTYLNSLSTVKGLRRSIDSLDAYNGDGRLQKAVAAYFAFNQDAYEKDYRQIVDIMKKPGITPEDQAKFDEIYNKLESEKEVRRKEVIESREEFGKKYLHKK